MNVTAVIPTLNEEKYIGECFRSLFDIKELTEVIVVDSVSSDSTLEIVKKWKEKFKKRGVGFKVLTEMRRGITRARDRGYREAEGKIIMSCDADTVYPQDYLKVALSRLGGDYVAVRGSSLVDEPPWFIRVERQIFRVMNHVVFALSNTVRRVRAYDVVFFKDVYLNGKVDVDIYAVEDEIGLSRLLNSVGKIYYEPSLTAVTSARRHKQGGLMHYLIKVILIDYWGCYILGKHFSVVKEYKRVD